MRELHSKFLPKELGYLGLIGESVQKVEVEGHQLAIQSPAHCRLTRDRPINYLRWLVPDDTHILIEGEPVDYFIFHPVGHVDKVTLERDIAKATAARGCRSRRLLKVLRLHPGTSMC